MSHETSFGDQTVSPAEKTERVGAVFTSVARRYDLMNDLMSAGLHRLWKDRFVRRVRPRPGEVILDMAGGTGDIAFRLARSGATVTVADINPAMLEVGRERAGKRAIQGLSWIEQNAEELSFEDNRFDAYTIAFGIRNVTHIDRALAEAHRVLKRGGRFLCMEFSTSEWPGFAELYQRYSSEVVPRIDSTR
jgi:demethylmenaquinone methyltransferase/2-methoxy-6-polyprenyl-1,4-benzoquinol methylase